MIVTKALTRFVAPLAIASMALAPLAATAANVAAPDANVPLAAEHYTLELPLGWHQVGQQNQATRSLTAYAPTGQTDSAMTDLLTVESIPLGLGNPEKLTLQSTYERMGGQYHSACTTSNLGKFQAGKVNGYESAFWVVGCGERPGTGRGEVAFVHVIQGPNTIYVIERIWQTAIWHQEGPPISVTDANNATQILKGFSVCETGSATHPCPPK